MASWLDKGTRSGAEILPTTLAVRAIVRANVLAIGRFTSLGLQRQNLGLNHQEIHPQIQAVLHLVASKTTQQITLI